MLKPTCGRHDLSHRSPSPSARGLGELCDRSCRPKAGLAGACDDNTSLAFSAEVVRPLFSDAHISRQRVGQPAADEVAGDAAAVEHFMMAAAAAQITRPATAARLLHLDMAARQPAPPCGII